MISLGRIDTHLGKRVTAILPDDAWAGVCFSMVVLLALIVLWLARILRRSRIRRNITMTREDHYEDGEPSIWLHRCPE